MSRFTNDEWESLALMALSKDEANHKILKSYDLNDLEIERIIRHLVVRPYKYFDNIKIDQISFHNYYSSFMTVMIETNYSIFNITLGYEINPFDDQKYAFDLIDNSNKHLNADELQLVLQRLKSAKYTKEIIEKYKQL